MPEATFDAGSQIITVTVPREILYDIDKMHALTRRLLTRVGCPTCHSGRVFNFKEEVEFVVRHQQGGELEIQGTLSHASL
jgi:hypothetical protein